MIKLTKRLIEMAPRKKLKFSMGDTAISKYSLGGRYVIGKITSIFREIGHDPEYEVTDEHGGTFYFLARELERVE